MRRPLLPFAVLAWIGLALHAGSARSSSYRFTVIAELDQDPYLSFLLVNAMNEAGQVAFIATIPQPPYTTQAVYRGDGGTPLLIFEGDNIDTGEVPSGQVAIDGTGRVFFSAYNPGLIGTQIRAGTGSGTEQIYSTLVDYDGLGFGGFGKLVARGDGELAFWAFVADPVGDPVGIFVGDGATARTVVSGEFAGLGDPALGANGEVAYSLEDPAGSDGIYREGPSGAAVPIARRGSGVFVCQFAGGCFSPEVGIDDAGRVAFRGFFDTGPSEYEEGIFIGDGASAPTQLIDSSGPFDTLAFPRLSPGGDLLFYGTLDASPSVPAIFRGPDPVADRVFGSGDALLGSTIASFHVGGFNDAGQVSFFAALANGKTAIVRADPVPEPASAALAGLASIAALTRLGRRRTSASSA